MTATFGKLSRQTLTFDEGLNIIEAPNEWGKSTWCAFLMAMLYGIDTGTRSKTGYLADKEHYAPWSGEPMSGSMDILWNDRKITLQRQNKGRTPMGEVKAFETETGIPVPELSVPAPGQVLLGVERSVFARAGFLKLSEMPVTEDESLRRRLNELVTTGDESGASDDLAQKLRDLKNKCRFNKKGLLPEAEAKLADLEQKLQQLQTLRYQISQIQERQTALDEQEKILKNQKQALHYQEHLQYAQKLTTAQMNRDSAKQSLSQAEQDCQNLPTEESIRQSLSGLQQLRDVRDSLHTKTQLLPPLPPVPEAQEAFRGKDPDQAVADAKADTKALQQLKDSLKKPTLYVLGGILVLGGGVLAAISQFIPGGVLLLLAVICFVLKATKQKKLQQQIAQLQNKYPGISPEAWEQAAYSYAETQQSYHKALADRQQLLADLNRQLEENNQAIAAATDGQGLTQYEEFCRGNMQKYATLQEKQRALRQAEDVLQALSGAGEQVQPPLFADTMTLSREDTEKNLTQTAAEKQLLHQRLGQCQGQMDTLGTEQTLQTQKQQLQNRISQLETYYCALTRAQETLLQATNELQRRFAPRISGRAQELFSRLTDGRYQRLSLCQDLSLEASTREETTLRGTLWRSDGTVDQLYLALRMAVAEELTPNAPLILDDALVRFDDVRLAETLQLLREEAEQKQVILFTCQSREKSILEEL